MKTFTVCMYVDPHTSMTSQDEADRLGYDDVVDYEYSDIERLIRNGLPGRVITFKRDVIFAELANAPCDFYVFDIGGMCVVDHGGRERLRWLHHVVRGLEDHPSTGFVPWSMMTWQAARTALEDLVLGDATEIPDGFKPPEFPNLYLPPKSLDFETNKSDAIDWMKRFVSVPTTAD